MSLSTNAQCLLSVAVGSTENVFSSKVDLYEIEGKYEFQYQTQLTIKAVI